MAKSKIETLWLMVVKKKIVNQINQILIKFTIWIIFFNFPYRELELECY